MIEPDATLDTRLANGRFVRVGGITDTGFVVRDGRIETDRDPDEAAWRSVDASGFFVLPALIQLGRPVGETARAAAAAGVATVIVTSDAPDLASLQREQEELAVTAQLDYAVAWRVPGSPTSADIFGAIERGVCTFDFPSVELARTCLPETDALTVRVPAQSLRDDNPGSLPPTWLAVATTTDQTEANRLASTNEARCFIELVLDEPNCNWAELATHSDRVIVSGGGDMLRSAFRSGVASNGVSPVAVARMTSMNAAQAFRLDGRKRGLEPRADADFVVFDPSATADSERRPGKVIFSMLRGEILLYNDELHTAPGDGMRLP